MPARDTMTTRRPRRVQSRQAEDRTPRARGRRVAVPKRVFGADYVSIHPPANTSVFNDARVSLGVSSRPPARVLQAGALPHRLDLRTDPPTSGGATDPSRMLHAKKHVISDRLRLSQYLASPMARLGQSGAGTQTLQVVVNPNELEFQKSGITLPFS